MVLQSRRISKSFHAKRVLNDINLSIGRGEIHGLVGKNGAGKSTYVNILTGLIRDYAGEVSFDGRAIDNEPVLTRQQMGLFLVPQHSSIIPEFSVAENICMGVWPVKGRGRIDWKSLFSGAINELERYGVSVDPHTKARNLSLVERRKLNIVRALFSEAKLIVLDEPTTSLTSEERDNLFSFIRELSAKGTSFIFISHYLDEVVKLCDRITVFRDGYAELVKPEDMNESTLSERIIGASVNLFERTPREHPENGPQSFSCDKLTGAGIKEVSMRVGAGEIVGLVGFPGSGARETLRALSGIAPCRGGKMYLGSDMRPFSVENPASAIDQGLVYVPYDRHEEGLVPEMSIAENLSLSIIRATLHRLGGRIDKKMEKGIVDRFYDHLKIKAKGSFEKVRALSGGNQQKVLVSKAFSCEPKLLLLDEPTIGIDIGSREEILGLVDELSLKGIGILYHTSDYAEMLRICDRVLFFANGMAMKSVENRNLDIDTIAQIRDSLQNS